MKVSSYISRIAKDFLIACGCLSILSALVLTLSSAETMNPSLLWQIILAASAFTSFKYALIDTPELGKRAQRFSFYICFVLADVFVIAWLWFFSSSQVMDRGILVAFILVILVVKGMVYAMMHIDGLKEAKRLNEKLSEYGHGGKSDS
jgi:hypothetical protein